MGRGPVRTAVGVRERYCFDVLVLGNRVSRPLASLPCSDPG